MSGLRAYLADVRSAIEMNDGHALAALLSLRDTSLIGSLGDLSSINVAVEVDKRLGQLDGLENVVSAHLCAATRLRLTTLADAFEWKCRSVTAFISYIDAIEGESWQLRAYVQSLMDLRLLSTLLGRTYAEEDEDAHKQLNILYQEAFRALMNDRSEKSGGSAKNSKKSGLLAITNQYFANAFQVNNFTFVNKLVHTMKIISYPRIKSHDVTYRYYEGLQCVLDGHYGDARRHLEYAYHHCLTSSTKNLRLILLHLIPVNMLSGRFPQREFLAHFNLNEFYALSQAVREGNLSKLNKEFQTHQKFFTHWNIYLLLEHVQLIAIRNLIKKLYVVRDKSAILEVSDCMRAMNFSEGHEKYDIEETECLLANLIQQKYMKGNIFFSEKKIALSKKDPFPKIGV